MNADSGSPLLVAWSAMLPALGRAAWLVDAGTLRVVAANAEAQALLGRPEAELAGADARSLIASPEDLAFWDEARRGQARSLCSDTVIADPSSGGVPVTRTIRPLRSDGVVTHFLVSVDDRSEVRRQQQAHDALLAELQATLESTGDGILVTDLAGRIRGFNRRFAQLWGLPDELLRRHDDTEVVGWMRRCVEDPHDFGRHFEALIASPQLDAEQRIVLASGRELECETRPQRSRGRLSGRVWAFRDRTGRAAAGQRIDQLATTDALTGLPNRLRIGQAIDESIRRARGAGGSFALLVVDLDRFGQINDSLGERYGDQVLCIAAERLRSSLHQGDTVARVGDDRFALLVVKADHRSAEAVARRVLVEIGRPCTLDGLQFTLTCSVGVALYPADGHDTEQLLQHAETAMQRAKVGGRGCLRFHQSSHDGELRKRTRLDQAMRQAIVCGRLRLKFQPQIDLRTGAVVGAEALIRWRDPELGDVPPAEFLPVAEDTGLAVTIGQWVLNQAVLRAATWRGRGAAMPVAVNVLASQFAQAEFVEQVAAALRRHDLPGSLLELELTEAILLREADVALVRLRELATLGVRLAVDDFGSGYSSLACLERFPIRRLKIDRRFVDGLPDDEGDAGIVRAIVQMSHALGLEVLAEGVETEAQREFLSRAGCDAYQGFLFAPALDALSLDERLRGRPPASGRRLTLVVRR